MSNFDDLPREAQARIEAAVAWRQRLREDPALELSTEYLDWSSDEANWRMLNALEEGLQAVDGHASAPEILDLRQAALNRVRRVLPRRSWSRTTFLRVAAAVLIVLGIGAASLIGYLRLPQSYTTDVGERRVVALDDGSRISLDSESQVRIRFTPTARSVELDRGRARFDVAHDTRRPFSVTAGNETVVAVGTSFDVERLDGKVVVTLIQGRIVVKGAAPADAPRIPVRPAVSLAAGEQLVAAKDIKPVVAPANLEVATAWEAGRLVFQHEPLAEAVERVNRYTDKPIRVDPSVAQIHINGVFNAGDISAFVSAVTSYFPVQATTDADNTIVLEKRM